MYSSLSICVNEPYHNTPNWCGWTGTTDCRSLFTAEHRAPSASCCFQTTGTDSSQRHYFFSMWFELQRGDLHCLRSVCLCSSISWLEIEVFFWQYCTFQWGEKDIETAFWPSYNILNFPQSDPIQSFTVGVTILSFHVDVRQQQQKDTSHRLVILKVGPGYPQGSLAKIVPYH